MKRRTKIFLGIAIAVFVLVAGFFIIVQVLSRRTFDAPEPDLRATDDPVMIERGRYLAYGPAHCADCHGPVEILTKALTAETPEESRALTLELDRMPLSGGFSYTFELGTLHFPNITPDEETGIGRYTDGQIARLLRHGVKPNGEALFPIMEYQNISDEDIVALLSFLRSQDPVYNPVPDNEMSFMGKAVKAFLIRPIGPERTPPVASPPEEATIERGEYLVNRIAQCAQCHSQRNLTDFSFTGPRLAGGPELLEPWAPHLIFVPPNLTPDVQTGHIVEWSEAEFVERFEAGILILASPMPWEAYARMSETDMRAIYRYLMSLDPVFNETGPRVRPKDDSMEVAIERE
jgi:mono/diheme cytochrome c family protein